MAAAAWPWPTRSAFFLMTKKQEPDPILARAARWQFLGKSPASFYLQLNKRIWRRLPSRLRDSHLVRSYGAKLHTLVCLRASRQQYFGTFFLRNRPMLELMRRLCAGKDNGATLRIAVLACSIGAEVYSILWSIRSARPDLKIVLHAMDISEDIVDFAERGVYGPRTPQLVGASIFDRLTGAERREMFDWDGEEAKIKSWLRDGVTWQTADATDPEFVAALGLHDMVVGSNFLCHMAPAEAEKCLRNIARLVEPGGYLFVSGVDLDVRTKVARDLGWRPVSELMPEIHDGDPAVRGDWPWHWWGLEPLDRRRPDWQLRYTAVFKIR
jgi:SAM-dependent methyltransferase